MPAPKSSALTLRRELALILIVKLLAVVALYQWFFDQPVDAAGAAWLAPVGVAADRATELPDPRNVTEEEAP